MRKIGTFIRECIRELQKVNWPTKDDVVLSTKVVVISVIILAILLGLADYFFFSGINIFVGQ